MNKTTSSMIPTQTELDMLKRNIVTIKRGMEEIDTKTVEVGVALLEIQDRKLYRFSGLTFAEFVDKEFNRSREWAYKIIKGQKALLSLPEGKRDSVKSQRAKETLADIPEGKRESAVDTAGDNPTSGQLKRSVKPTEVHELDQTGNVIPPEILNDWNRALKCKTLVDSISNVKCSLEKATADEDVIIAEIPNLVLAALKNVYKDLGRIIPYTVCTSCRGLQRGKCGLCKGRGFISKFLYDNAVPEKTKKLRGDK